MRLKPFNSLLYWSAPTTVGKISYHIEIRVLKKKKKEVIS